MHACDVAVAVSSENDDNTNNAVTYAHRRQSPHVLLGMNESIIYSHKKKKNDGIDSTFDNGNRRKCLLFFFFF